MAGHPAPPEDPAPLPEGAVSRWLEPEPGLRLHLLELCPQGQGTVLILPGFFRRAESDTHLEMGAHLARRRAVWLLDLRGHGRSGGRYTFGREEVRDVEAALAHLRDHAPGPVHLVGLSMGGYLAVKALGGAPEAWPEVRSLVVISSPGRWARVWPRPDPRLPFQARVPPGDLARPPRMDLGALFGRRSEAADLVERLRVPLQVHHHEGDWLIAYRLGRELFDRAPEPKELRRYGGDGRVDHADNLVRRHFPDLMAQVEAWMDRAEGTRGATPGPES